MWKMGKSCIVYNHKHSLGRTWSRILQVRVNFTCYYRMPKVWTHEIYTYVCILKYSAGSGKMKWNLSISWSHYSIGLKSTYVHSFHKDPWFCLCFEVNVFFCNLRIMFIRQRNEGRSVAQHVWVVLLYKAISEYLVVVAVATAVKTLDVV